MKFSIRDFFSKCDQIRMKLRIWSHLLKNSLIENFIFYAVIYVSKKQPKQNFSNDVTYHWEALKESSNDRKLV